MKPKHMQEFKNNLDFDNIKKLLRKEDCLKKKQERFDKNARIF